MSLIWIILVNTIIGMVLFPIEIQLTTWYADKKYGIDVTEEIFDDNVKHLEDLSVMKGINYKWFTYVIYVLNFILWEILIPTNVYLNLSRIKDLHEIRGGDDRVIIRRKDRKKAKEAAYKEVVLYAKDIIEISKDRRNRQITLLNDFIDLLNSKRSDNVQYDGTENAIDMFKFIIEHMQKEIEDYDMFLEATKNYK